MKIQDINLDDYEFGERLNDDTIVLRRKEPKYPKWADLKEIRGVFINNKSNLETVDAFSPVQIDKNIFLTEKHAKSALAMTQISQLMPYYGGEITDEEWKDPNTMKYVIKRKGDNRIMDIVSRYYYFLAFHTEEQGYAFIENNEQLVKDYLMIE